MYFKVVVECGHVGAGRSIEAVRYWQARNVSHALSSAWALPRAKKKSLHAVKSVVPISRQEYIVGLKQEAQDPYLSCPPRDFIVEQGRMTN